MNKATSIIRVAILLALSAICVIGIFSEPLEDSPAWETIWILSKAIGIIAGYGIYRLYNLWCKDPLIEKYNQWCASIEEEDGE